MSKYSEEILKFIGTEIKSDAPRGTYIWTVDKENGMQMLAESRGYGALKNNDKLQDELTNFIAEAIQEKINRSCDTTLTQKVLEVLEGKKSFTGFIVDHDFPEVARLIVECVKEVGE